MTMCDRVRDEAIGSEMRLAGALACGALLCLAHGFSPALAPFAPVPLLASLRGATPRMALYLGLISGTANAIIVAGFAHAGLALAALVIGSYALADALFAILTTVALGSATGWPRIIVAAAVWPAVEWLHAQVPFSVPDILGDTQHTGPLLWAARLGGTYLLSGLLVAMAAAIVEAGVGWRADPGLRALRPALVITCIAAAAALAGRASGSVRAQPAAAFDVTVVQGGIPDWAYARAQAEPAWRRATEETYVSLTRGAPPTELTVWPETAIPRIWGETEGTRELLERVREQRGGSLLVGLPRRDAAGSYANTAVLIEPGIGPTQEPRFADKRRLALLAEAGFGPGHGPGIVDSRVGRLGVVFCLESVAPHYGREVTRAGAQVLVVLAEGGRFGGTPVGRIHAQRSILRAVENGRPVIHAGQHGYSMLIGPDGSHTTPARPFVSTIVHGSIDPVDPASLTPYGRFGAWSVWLGMLAAVAVVLTRLLRRRRRGAAGA